MVLEAEILTTFLLERTSAEEALPRDRFRKMFPKNTPEGMVAEIRHSIINNLTRRSETVNTSIQQRGSRNCGTTVSSSRNVGDGKSLTKLSDNLNTVSSLLDDEIAHITSEYQLLLSNLKQDISFLNDVAFPSNKEGSVSEGFLDDTLSSLRSLERLVRDNS